MAISFDLAKDTANRKKHGLSLSQADAFDFVTAILTEDGSERYGEQRLRALGTLADGSIVVLVFIDLGGEDIRVISLRNATPRERRQWANA